jgi:hypothetical protein
MFEIEVIILTHGGSKDMDAEESESSDSSDSSDSSESSDSSDSYSSESADWDKKWDMYSSDVRTKIHRALHSVCSWFHRQPAYVKVCIGFGLALWFFWRVLHMPEVHFCTKVCVAKVCRSTAETRLLLGKEPRLSPRRTFL